MRYLLNISYDGTDFNGWQTNPKGRTVQDAVQKALSKLLKEEKKITGASRTDSGVHASDQYAHFDHHKELPYGLLFDGMNSILPSDVRIKGAQIVESTFHARYSALYKIYAYIITSNPVSLPILNRYSLNIRRKLDQVRIKEALRLFTGNKDFSSFRASGCSAKTPVITLDNAELINWGTKICLVFSARSFLQHMIRNIVGTLIYVGLGKITPEYITCLFDKKDRRLAPPTAAAKGLFLVKIRY